MAKLKFYKVVNPRSWVNIIFLWFILGEIDSHKFVFWYSKKQKKFILDKKKSEF